MKDHTSERMLKKIVKKPLKIAMSCVIVGAIAYQTFTIPTESKQSFACTTEQECKSVAEAAKQKRDALAREQQALEAKSNDIKSQVENLMAQLGLYQTELVVTNIELSNLKAKQEELNINISENKEKMKERLVETQLSLETNTPLQFIASSTSITDFIERLQVVNDLSEADNAIVQTLIEQVKQLKENEVKQNARLQEIGKLTAEAEQLKAAKKSELDTYLVELQQKIAAQQNAASQVTQSEQQLKELESAKALAAQVEVATTVNTNTVTTPFTSTPTTPTTPTTPVATTPSNPTPTTPTTPIAPAPNATGIIGVARKYLGVPYVWGGSTPAGFDCSGFTSYVYREALGKNIGRVTTNQENAGTVISVSQAQPGDLLFWGPRGGTSHVAIYLGNNQYIHAPYAGRTVEISTTQYWAPSFALRVS